VNEIDWWTPTIVLGTGLIVGVVLALFQRRASGPPDEAALRAQRFEDLVAEKDQLLRAIKGLQDRSIDGRQEGHQDEIGRLEVRAAEVLRQIEDAPPPTETSQNDHEVDVPEKPAVRGMNPETRGMLKGAGVVLMGVVLVVVLLQSTKQRAEGEVMTGGDETSNGAGMGQDRAAPQDMSSTMPTAPAQPGGAGMTAPPMTAIDTPGLRAAKAAVQANPEDIEALENLGWELIGARGWTDAWSVAQELQAKAPERPDGYTIAGNVRLRMRLVDEAEAQFVKALARDPENAIALGETDPYLQELLTAARQPPRPPQTSMPSGHPPVANSSASSSGAEALGPKDVAGRISLAPGTTLPNAGKLFIYARHPGQSAGPPAAVIAVPSPTLPMEFRLGPANRMAPGVPYPETTLDLQVRWDLDGNATTKMPGDLVSSMQGVPVGSSGLELVLQAQ
jgi:hypothetical protein